MEHILSCHEVLPYRFANTTTGEQGVLSFPDGSASFDCANAELDNDVLVVTNGTVGNTYDPDTNPIDPNDNTDVLNNIARSADYSITLKDDGKVLYRWGSLIKLPTDIRLYARLELPAEWKGEDAPEFTVKKAQLIVNHKITNNPNDQLRPEDIENEAATGRKPSYVVNDDDVWTSFVPCFEGDGDLISGEDGTGDPDSLPVGTVLKGIFKGDNLAAVNPPQLLSADLREGFTNAFYTSLNRDPFEWSYRNLLEADNVFNFSGFPLPLTEEEAIASDLELVSGPRWRLKAGKFGQDLPGLDIPKRECSPPPFTNDNIKYPVEEPTTTAINLLDWDEEANGPSPLATSKGWVDVTNNGAVEVANIVNGTPVTTNGLPMTDDFDLAVYIKGDRKPTALFDATLEIEYFLP